MGRSALEKISKASNVELKMDRKRNLCIVKNKKIQHTTKAKMSVAGLKWEPEKGNIFNTKVHNT